MEVNEKVEALSAFAREFPALIKQVDGDSSMGMEDASATITVENPSS